MPTYNNRILHRISGTTSQVTPAQKILMVGELGYTYATGDSNGGDRLFIGVAPYNDSNNAATVIHTIGGKYYTDMMHHPKGTLTAGGAIITDANNKIDKLLVDNFVIDNNAITNTNREITVDAQGDVILTTNGAGVINVSNSKITNVADPTALTDAVNIQYMRATAGLVKGNTGEKPWRSNHLPDYYLSILGSTAGSNITTTVSNPLNVNGIAQVNIDLSDNPSITSATIGGITLNNSILTAVGNIILDPNSDTGPAGKVVIQGDLQVDGVTTTINSTELTINDKLITLANNSPDSATSNGGGILLAGANASMIYNSTTDKWVFNKDISAPNLNVTGDFVASTLTGKYLGFDSDFNAKSTTDLSEGTNLYYTQARFDSALGDKTTTNVAEGTNLYYTQARFDTAFTAKSTDNLSEGSTNLYFTETRVKNSLSVNDAGGDGSLTYDSSSGQFTYTGPSSTEVRSHFAAQGDLAYDSSTGVFSIDVENVYTSVNFDSDLGSTTTASLPEGTNLYYTTVRFDSDFNDNNTDNLSEGSTNLYFTAERVDDRVSELLAAAEGLDATYDDASGVLTLSTELATSTNIGGASFDSIDFVVTTGQVELNIIDCGTY